MRCLHGAGRRRCGVLLPAAAGGARRPRRHHGGRPRHAGGTGTAAARVRRGAGGSVRILHCRHDHAGAGVAGADAHVLGAGAARAHAAKPVPMRHPHAYPACGSQRRRGHAGCRGRAAAQGGRAMTTLAPSRRQVVAGGGALIVSISIGATRALAQGPQASPPTPPLPGSLKGAPMLDSWIRIDADGAVTVFTGKAELGQGIKTALLQVASEELGVAMPRIKLVTADTARTPNEGYTSGSQSMPNGATAIRNAAAQVREILLARAAERLGTDIDHVKLRDGTVTSDDGKSIGIGELVGDDVLHVRAQPTSKLTDPSSYTLIGKPVARVDIPV